MSWVVLTPLKLWQLLVHLTVLSHSAPKLVSRYNYVGGICISVEIAVLTRVDNVTRIRILKNEELEELVKKFEEEEAKKWQWFSLLNSQLTKCAACVCSLFVYCVARNVLMSLSCFSCLFFVLPTSCLLYKELNTISLCCCHSSDRCSKSTPSLPLHNTHRQKLS